MLASNLSHAGFFQNVVLDVYFLALILSQAQLRIWPSARYSIYRQEILRMNKPSSRCWKTSNYRAMKIQPYRFAAVQFPTDLPTTRKGSRQRPSSLSPLLVVSSYPPFDHPLIAIRRDRTTHLPRILFFVTQPSASATPSADQEGNGLETASAFKAVCSMTVGKANPPCPFREMNAESSGTWMIIFPFAMDGKDLLGRLLLRVLL